MPNFNKLGDQAKANPGQVVMGGEEDFDATKAAMAELMGLAVEDLRGWVTVAVTSEGHAMIGGNLGTESGDPEEHKRAVAAFLLDTATDLDPGLLDSLLAMAMAMMVADEA